MAWYPSAERLHSPWTYGAFTPTSVICHRTYGREAGDMAVALGTARKGISFHFYVTKKGAVRQFVDTSVKAAHAKGANGWSIGIEVESLGNEDPMTDPQIKALGGLVHWLADTHKIPLIYDSGPQRKGQRPGFIAHAAVAGSDHGDKWTSQEWDKIVGAPTSAPSPPVMVPVVTDTDFATAERSLRGIGLQARRTYVLNGLQKNQVVAQAPAAGTLVTYGSYVDLTVDKGAAMNVVNWNGELHVFAVENANIVHRWFSGRTKWETESVCGSNNRYGTLKDAVTATTATAVVEYGQLHVFAGQFHAWWDPVTNKWSAEKLP